MANTAVKVRRTNPALDDPSAGPPLLAGGSSGNAVAPWQNRIVAHAEVDPAELVAHPLNWRLHPRGQQQAMTAVLGDVGWVDGVIVNRASLGSYSR